MMYNNVSVSHSINIIKIELLIGNIILRRYLIKYPAVNIKKQ